MSITPDKISACLVTRGDRPDMLERIIATLPYDEVIVWDNSERPQDLKVYGRFAAMAEAKHDVCYTQDDDCIFRDHDALMAEYEEDVPTYTYGHGDNDGGYGDLPLPPGGALVPKHVAFDAFARYIQEWPMDEGLLYEADFIIGVLYPRFRQVRLPFEIVMDVAQSPERLCNQPWQADLKREMTERARAIRDAAKVPA